MCVCVCVCVCVCMCVCVYTEVIAMDVDVDAPNIFICEHGSRGLSGSVLMVRLGHLSIKDEIRDIQDLAHLSTHTSKSTHNNTKDHLSITQITDDARGAPTAAAAAAAAAAAVELSPAVTNDRNRYLVQVERVGVDLLLHAEVRC